MRLDYPKDLAKNLNFRVDIRNRCINDPVLRHEMKELCRRDILTWVNLFCWTKDPRKSTPVLPFITYDYQDKYILEVEDAIDKQYDRLSEKSRDAGASWCILYVLNHKWQFEIGSDFRVGSRKEEFVDKLNVIDTLLEKVRFNLARQPGWLLPKGFTIKDHAGFMRIVNPENGNTIVGESANPHFASGGRSKAVLMDEFSKWDVTIAKSAWSATADVTGCRLPLSTPLGSGNKFAMLAHGTEEKIVKSTLHWTLHPNKTKGLYYKSGVESIPILTKEKAFELWKIGYEVRSEWYDAECERRSESDVAQELDINYLMSGYPFFSMKALALQKIFPLHVRSNEIEPIPFERHILINLIETDGKIEPRDKDGWLRVYEYPEIGKQYIVAADTSEGLAKGDEATIVVREKFTNDIIAVANGAYPPDDIAYKIQKVAKWYNVALTAPENNNHGFTTCNILRNLDCNLYHTMTQGGDVKKPGFTTTAQTRPLMLDLLEQQIRKNEFAMRDEILIKQCRTFVKNQKSGKPEADGDFKDDVVMACAISGWMVKEHPFQAKADDNSGARRRKIEEFKKPVVRFR